MGTIYDTTLAISISKFLYLNFYIEIANVEIANKIKNSKIVAKKKQKQ